MTKLKMKCEVEFDPKKYGWNALVFKFKKKEDREAMMTWINMWSGK